MCDFSPVRNWMIALGILIGFAVSSAFFALGWANSPWPLLLISIISFGIAATGCAVAIGLIRLALDAVELYCKCKGRACAGPCSLLPKWMMTIMVGLAGLCIASVLGATVPGNIAIEPAVLIAGLLILVFTGIAAFAVLDLSKC